MTPRLTDLVLGYVSRSNSPWRRWVSVPLWVLDEEGNQPAGKVKVELQKRNPRPVEGEVRLFDNYFLIHGKGREWVAAQLDDRLPTATITFGSWFYNCAFGNVSIRTSHCEIIVTMPSFDWFTHAHFSLPETAYSGRLLLQNDIVMKTPLNKKKHVLINCSEWDVAVPEEEQSAICAAMSALLVFEPIISSGGD